MLCSFSLDHLRGNEKSEKKKESHGLKKRRKRKDHRVWGDGERGGDWISVRSLVNLLESEEILSARFSVEVEVEVSDEEEEEESDEIEATSEGEQDEDEGIDGKEVESEEGAEKGTSESETNGASI